MCFIGTKKNTTKQNKQIKEHKWKRTNDVKKTFPLLQVYKHNLLLLQRLGGGSEGFSSHLTKNDVYSLHTMASWNIERLICSSKIIVFETKYSWLHIIWLASLSAPYQSIALRKICSLDSRWLNFYNPRSYLMEPRQRKVFQFFFFYFYNKARSIMCTISPQVTTDALHIAGNYMQLDSWLVVL